MIQYIELSTDITISTTQDGFEPKSLELRIEHANNSAAIMTTVHSVMPQANSQSLVTLKLRPQYGGDYIPLSLLGGGNICVLYINFPSEELGRGLVTRRWFEPALKSSWNNVPIPDANRIAVKYQRIFTAKEFMRIKMGQIPVSMEDKWFAYYEANCLYWYRSWTGLGVFEVTIDPTSDGAIVTNVITNNDPEFNARAISGEMLETLFSGMCVEAEKIFDV